ncbi:MAG: metallophosphoesterase family protein [Nanobdellota archaeon]
MCKKPEAGMEMKALVFGDTHGDIFMLEILKRKAEQADVVFCLGDLTIFGEDLELMLAILNEFPVPVYLIHGNHEIEEEMEAAVKEYENLTYIHKQLTPLNEYELIGYGGDGFSRKDKMFEELAQEFKSNMTSAHKTIILLHGPPADTNLDIPFENHHSGSESYRQFLEETTPLAAFVGHIHECEGEFDMIGETIIHNPGPEGTLINLAELSTKRNPKTTINQ